MFPQNYAVLVVGDPGTGIFEFSCYLAASYLKNDERVVFVETDPSPERVRKQLRRFGISALEFEMDGKLVIVDCSVSSVDQGYDPGTRRVKDRTDLKSVQTQVIEGMRTVGGPPVRVIFDSLTPLHENNQSEAICAFFEDLCSTVRKDGNLTCTIHRGIIHNDQVERVSSLADGIVELVITKQFKRFIRILRMKGMEIKPKWVQFDFEKSEEDEATVLGWEKEQQSS